MAVAVPAGTDRRPTRDPEADLRAQPPALEIDLDAPLYTAKDARARRSPQFRPVDYGEEVEVAPGHPRHVRRRRPHPRLGDHPAARPRTARAARSG